MKTRKSSGVIYSRKKHNLKMGLKKTGKGVSLGSLLIVIATALLPMWLNKETLRQEAERMRRAQINFSDLLRIAADEAPEITEATYFTVDIPKIKARSKVILNIDAANSFEYGQALSKGVAHAKGTFLPGMNGAVTLFAHSTDIEANVGRYNAVFYRLDELVKGDQVSIWYLGRKYDYLVTGSKVIDPSNVEVFTTQPGAQKLYLVTCTPRGSTKNRLVVEAERKI